MFNIVGKVAFDEQQEWIEYILNLKETENITMILNKQFVLFVEKCNNTYVVQVYSQYKVNKFRKEIQINKNSSIDKMEYSNKEELAMIAHIDYLFQEYVWTPITFREVFHGLLGTAGALAMVSVMTCVAACV